MPDFLVVIRTPSSVDVRMLTAPTLLAAKDTIREQFKRGLSADVNGPERVQIGVVLLADFVAFDPERDAQQKP